MPSQQLRQLEDKISGMQQRSKVGVFIDLDGLLTDRDDLQDELIAENVRMFAQAVGRFCSGTVYYSHEVVTSDGIDHKAWSRRGFRKVFTQEEGYTTDSVNLDLLFDVHAAALQMQFNTVILVVGKTNYNELSRRLIHDGVAVVLICNYPREHRVLPRDSCIYVPTHALFEDQYKDQHKEPDFDAEGYDYSSFIRLVATSERMMPFVGINYFVKRVMWRIGDDFREQRLCQQLFQAARERNLIEVYERDNINESGNKVSAFKLNQEHPLVAEVVAELEETAHPPTQPGVDTEEFSHRSPVGTGVVSSTSPQS